MVLENLFKLTKDSNRDMTLIVLTTIFFENNLLHKATHVAIESWLITPRNSCQSIMNIEGIEHFLDLLRKLLILFTKETKECIGEYEWEVLPSAMRLVEAGIKFKRGAYGSILDVKFIDGILEIPQLLIHDVTETGFRNLISYEQCHSKCEAWITSYAILLDNLIKTAKDMDILCENRIIHNWLNPEDVAQLFNKLYHDTYFNTPWAFISTFAAVSLLVMTLLQTLYTMEN
jgi:hypothetical protein